MVDVVSRGVPRVHLTTPGLGLLFWLPVRAGKSIPWDQSPTLGKMKANFFFWLRNFEANLRLR